jgi:hypothetical protein
VGLVRKIDHDVLLGLGHISHVILLGVVGREPVNEPQRNFRSPVQNVADPGKIVGLRVKLFKAI